MPSRHATHLVCLALASLNACVVACSSGEDTPSNPSSGAAGGTGGTMGVGGSMAGTGATAGTAQAGSTSTGGAGGSAGSAAGSVGQGGAGAGGGAGANGGKGGAGSGVGGSSGGMAGASAGSAGGGLGGIGGSAGSTLGGQGGIDAGGMAGNGAGTAGSGGGGAFTLTNPDFVNMTGCSKDMASSCAVFPRDLASYMSGPNVSPELDWTGVPPGTMSFAVILQDLTNGNAHWVLWNIPGDLAMLPADIDKTTNQPATPAGSQQTNATFANSTTMDGYFGPGSACNVYEFVLYALSVATFTPTSTTDANAVRTALDGAGAMVLGKASLRGRQNYNDSCTVPAARTAP